MNSGRVIRTICDSSKLLKRSYSSRKLTNTEVRQKRNELFGREQARQLAHITRVEKIEVEHEGPPENCTLLMNKGLSTPFNVAMHIQELLMTRSVLALVNEKPWDMHRPLVDNCRLRFLHFKDEDPELVNQAFWRSCSFILGYILDRAFKDEHYVELCSFPKPNVRSGSFIYDVDLGLPDWNPTQAELQCLSRIGGQLHHKDMKFERLEVDASLAAKMFEDNRFKAAQIPAIAEQSDSGSVVTVYRLGDHVDISRGPLISNTRLVGRFNVTAVHDIESSDLGPMKRVQGIATPTQLPVHFWTFDLLAKRAKDKSTAPLPGLRIKPAATAQSNGP